MESKKHGTDADATLYAMLTVIDVMRKLGQVENALAIAREMLDIRRKNLGESHWDTILARHSVVCLLALSGQQQQALAMQEETMSLLTESDGEVYTDAVCVLTLCLMLDVMSLCDLKTTKPCEQVMNLFCEMHNSYILSQLRHTDLRSCYFAPTPILSLLGKLEKTLRKGGHEEEAEMLLRQGKAIVNMITKGKEAGASCKKRKKRSGTSS